MIPGVTMHLGRTSPVLALLPGSSPSGVPPGAARRGRLGPGRRDERGGDRLAGAAARPGGQPRAVGRCRGGGLLAAGSGRRGGAAPLAERPPRRGPGDRERGAAGRRARPDRLPGPGRAARPARVRRPARRVVALVRVGRGREVHADRGPAPGRAADRGEHGVRPGGPGEPDDRPGPGRPGDRADRPGPGHHPGRGELGGAGGELRADPPWPPASADRAGPARAVR